jgi:hypothetical protein
LLFFALFAFFCGAKSLNGTMINSAPDKWVNRPPLYTLLVEVVGWTMDRTADLPKSQRFTFGQRLDNLALDALQSVVKAIFTGDARQKQEHLGELILSVEQSRVLWRLAQDRRWISQQQLLHVSGKLDEAGRMANGWRQQQARRAPPG